MSHLSLEKRDVQEASCCHHIPLWSRSERPSREQYKAVFNEISKLVDIKIINFAPHLVIIEICADDTRQCL